MDIIKKQEKPANQQEKLKSLSSTVSWEAPEYEFIPKSSNWFWVVGIFTVTLAFVSILFDNFLLAIFILLAGFAVALYASRKPRKIWFSLNPRGVQIADRIYPYENLDSFWIHYDPPFKKNLTLTPKKLFMPRISLPFEDTDPNAIREYLLKFLKEKQHEESATETLMRLLRF